MAKQELDLMREDYERNNRIDPDSWPLELDSGAWGEEEMCRRFS
jgi:hypothetical protein